MYEFLLERRHFDYLNNYMVFLYDLPRVLENVQRFSSGWQRDGHVVTVAPDLHQLKALSSFSHNYIKQFDSSVSALSDLVSDNLSTLATFSDECKAIASIAPEKGQLQINYLDFKQFSLSRSQWWMLFPPAEVRGLTHELYLRFFSIRQKVLDLKFSIKELNEGIHNIFARFVRYLSVSACRCHVQRSYLETCYISGSGVLRGALALIPGNSQDARAAQARQHLREISLIYSAASSAINNLNDFLFAMLRFIDMAQHELVSVRSSMKLSQLLLLLSEATDRMQEVKTMIGWMQQWSRK